MRSFKVKFLITIFITLFSINLNAMDCSYELFTINSSKNTKIIDFINQLSDECGFSVIISDPNTQKYLQSSLNKTNLQKLTIDEVLDIILRENNLSYTLQNNLLKISYLTTKVFNIDYIISQRKSKGSTDVTLSSSSGKNGNNGITTIASSDGSSARNTSSSNAQSGIKIESIDEVKFWDDLEQEFRSVLNRPSDSYVAPQPIINKNAGLITVTATSRQLKRFESYLKKLQAKVKLQVLIDVQLLAVTMNKGQTTGINWAQLYKLQNMKLSMHTLNAKNVGDFTSNPAKISTFSANPIKQTAGLISITGDGTLNEVIKFLQTQGDVSSISNPKVLTLNNQPALITVGTEYFYKITSTETLAGGTGTGAQSQNENIQSVFAGVLLTITPEISDDKTITLKINPSLSETTTDMSQTLNTDRKMPPDLDRRQLSSVVTIKDGNKVILGGLINTKNAIHENKVPILGDIPILNYLFKHEEKMKTIQELVIIIEPHIIHKEKNSISLRDLGYKELHNELLDDSSTKTKKPIANKAEHFSKNIHKKEKGGSI